MAILVDVRSLRLGLTGSRCCSLSFVRFSYRGYASKEVWVLGLGVIDLTSAALWVSHAKSVSQCCPTRVLYIVRSPLVSSFGGSMPLHGDRVSISMLHIPLSCVPRSNQDPYVLVYPRADAFTTDFLDEPHLLGLFQRPVVRRGVGDLFCASTARSRTLTIRSGKELHPVFPAAPRGFLFMLWSRSGPYFTNPPIANNPI